MTLIRNANVLWGRDLRLVEDTTLVLDGARVAGTGGAVVRPAETLDASGLVLLPGFVDAHVHIGFADPAEVLRRGVTVVRDLGWPPAEIFPLTRVSARPGFDGPLVLAAGPILTAPGGYPTRAVWAPEGTGREVPDPDEARAAVREVAAAGAALVKFSLNPPVGPVLDRDTLGALVGAAHDAGLTTTGHVHGVGELEKALDCAADELAHMLMSEEEIPDRVIDRMVDADMVVVPTLSIRAGRDREVAIANLARWRGAGGRIVYGTDLGNEGPRPGIDPSEVRAMAAAGYSTVEIVRAATVDAAHHLRLPSKGALAPGLDADVIAAPVDALDDPAKLCDVKMVWREGRRVV
ncbi:MAG TPA: amidohydrolase family protein [Actinomycetota bacterium]|nr:amidohydrolase family protein [Actinomycetota bacterium]